MTLECINPEDLPTSSTYTQVVVATGSRLVFVAGQEPEDEHGNLVGAGDLAAQAQQVFAKVGHRREYLPVIEKARVALFADHKPADALIGVQTLSNPEYLIEVEAIAVADG